jgi:hypothetical protein
MNQTMAIEEKFSANWNSIKAVIIGYLADIVGVVVVSLVPIVLIPAARYSAGV